MEAQNKSKKDVGPLLLEVSRTDLDAPTDRCVVCRSRVNEMTFRQYKRTAVVMDFSQFDPTELVRLLDMDKSNGRSFEPPTFLDFLIFPILAT